MEVHHCMCEVIRQCFLHELREDYAEADENLLNS